MEFATEYPMEYCMGYSMDHSMEYPMEYCMDDICQSRTDRFQNAEGSLTVRIRTRSLSNPQGSLKVPYGSLSDRLRIAYGYVRVPYAIRTRSVHDRVPIMYGSMKDHLWIA